jgi:hypothetical protein
MNHPLHFITFWQSLKLFLPYFSSLEVEGQYLGSKFGKIPLKKHCSSSMQVSINGFGAMESNLKTLF